MLEFILSIIGTIVIVSGMLVYIEKDRHKALEKAKKYAIQIYNEHETDPKYKQFTTIMGNDVKVVVFDEAYLAIRKDSSNFTPVLLPFRTAKVFLINSSFDNCPTQLKSFIFDKQLTDIISINQTEKMVDERYINMNPQFRTYLFKYASSKVHAYKTYKIYKNKKYV